MDQAIPGAEETSRRRQWWMWGLAVAAIWTIQLAVLWRVPYVPLVDLPNHMARHYLEYLHLSGQSLPPQYEVHYQLLPNLAADLVVPGLMFAFEPLTACKLFLSALLLLCWIGPALFILECGHYGPGARVAVLFLLPLSFSGAFLYGYINFCAGFGLAFLALAHYVRLNRCEVPAPRAWLLHALLVGLVLLSHLAGWVIYGVVVGCHTLAALVAWLRHQGWLPWGALALLPSVALFGAYHVSGSAVDPLGGGFQWGSGADKLARLPATLFRAYHLGIDGLSLLLWLAAAGVLFGSTWRRGSVLTWLHLSVAALFGCFLILPVGLGSTYGADERVIPAIVVCALAVAATLPVRRVVLGSALLALCLVLRVGSVAAAWEDLGRRLDVHAGAFDCIEPGSRIMAVVLIPESSKRHPETHFVSWAVVARRAFVPTVYSIPGQHPLTIRSAGHGRKDLFWHYSCVNPRAERHALDAEHTRANYDYVWLYNPEGRPALLPDAFECVFAAEALTVWRVR